MAAEIGKGPRGGSMVLVKENNWPPWQWYLGHIVEIHPGKGRLSVRSDIITPSLLYIYEKAATNPLKWQQVYL